MEDLDRRRERNASPEAIRLNHAGNSQSAPSPGRSVALERGGSIVAAGSLPLIPACEKLTSSRRLNWEPAWQQASTAQDSSRAESAARHAAYPSWAHRQQT